MVKYYIPVEDGDGHVYLSENEADANRISKLLEKDYDNLKDKDLDFIDSFDTLDGREYYIVLKDDLESE